MRNLSVTIAAVVLTSLVGGGGPATAAPPAGSYADHVTSCVQQMGFSGHHNPGMHRGRSGWDAGHSCDLEH